MLKCRRKTLFKIIDLSDKFEKIGSSNCLSFNMHHNNIARIMTDGWQVRDGNSKRILLGGTVLSKLPAYG